MLLFAQVARAMAEPPSFAAPFEGPKIESWAYDAFGLRPARLDGSAVGRCPFDYDALAERGCAKSIESIRRTSTSLGAGWVWLSLDPVGSEGRLRTPNALGPWAYANLSPLMMTDPDGRDVTCVRPEGRFPGESEAECHARTGKASARQRDAQGNFVGAPEEMAAGERQAAHPPKSVMVDGSPCDTYCLSALSRSTLYPMGEGQHVSGAALQEAWQSMPDPEANYSIWHSPWEGAKSSSGQGMLTRDLLRHDRDSLSPADRAVLAAWQDFYTREAQFNENYDNLYGVDLDVFEYSQEVGGHDLGMAWSGRDYYDNQLSDEQRTDLALSGAGKLGEKGFEYGGFVWGGMTVIRPGLSPYQVGSYDELLNLSKTGDDLAIHHVGQAHAMEQLVPGSLSCDRPNHRVANA